jgi:hypothetical protein
MKWWRFLPIVFVVFSFNAWAISVPASSPNTSFGDTTINYLKIKSAQPVKETKGLFGRLKERMTKLLMKNPRSGQSTTAKKKTLTLVSIALILLGVGLISLTGSLFPVLLSLAGLIIGIKAVRMKGEINTATVPDKVETTSVPKRKSWFRRNLAWIIPVILVIGGLAALAIAWGNARFG